MHDVKKFEFTLQLEKLRLNNLEVVGKYKNAKCYTYEQSTKMQLKLDLTKERWCKSGKIYNSLGLKFNY